MENVFRHVRQNVLRGLLAIIPLALSFIAIRFLYILIDQRIMGFVNRLLGFQVPGLGILILIATLYLLGLVASNVVGKQLFYVMDRIFHRIPLVKTIYQIGKQFVAAISKPEKNIFKRCVLVRLKDGIWVLAFVTGEIVDKQDPTQKVLEVFVPTPPNPVSGMVFFVKEADVRDPGWNIDDAMRVVVSCGILGPKEIE